MARFISEDKVPVFLEDDPEHIIYIRPKMNVGVYNRAMSKMATISASASTQDTSIGLDIGAYNLALLTSNILGWAGPDFDSVPCTPENIERLDPDDPLLDRVLAEINRRNQPSKGDKSPNSSSVNGSTASKPQPKATA